jgi:predicted AlkP superfamily pyrophosphatase or phosphodiesterase
MTPHVVLMSIPGLRDRDLARMPTLSALMAGGQQASLTASFPAVTWPVQANMLTGQLPAAHGVVGNGFYWRDTQQVEMWTAGNDKLAAPQIWDLLHQRDPRRSSAAWFPMLSKGCGADYVCLPAPVHNPDGTEGLWCYTKPADLYGVLREAFGDFPLQHFWGPLANIRSTAWIVNSAVAAAARFRPEFCYLYLPHLDYAAQKFGPDSPPALAAATELDTVLALLLAGFDGVYGADELLWLAASEYAITPVDHVSYPNRVLREAGLLRVREESDGEHLDLQASAAWALVDHQFSHVFVRHADPTVIRCVCDLFRGTAGIDEVLTGAALAAYHLNHPRSGEVVLVSAPDSWQAYYWWFDDARAPGFARTVDIHRKPGYDPVELHFDPATRSIPLDAALVKGSHGAPVRSASQRGVLLASRSGVWDRPQLADIDVAGLVLRAFER